MATPVQGFLTWRCWNLLRRSWLALIVLGGCILASIIAAILLTVNVFMVNFTIALEPEEDIPSPIVPIDPIYVLSLAIPALTDVLVTSILLTFLLRSRSEVYTRRFRRVITRLTVIAWEAAVPPCACAIVAVATYVALLNSNYWNLTFQSILGKLYVISLYVTLNGRAELALQHRRSYVPTISSVRPSFGQRPHVAVTIHTTSHAPESFLDPMMSDPNGSMTESSAPGTSRHPHSPISDSPMVEVPSERWTSPLVPPRRILRMHGDRDKLRSSPC
ncbi:uncharacterized protein STEHIDRAFT_124460 [Stereum hirsutum FP-91666 SS1]|uniref:uncharacterized protein n=1 Tax=Stereum hirsutum (strain FP-91666) TaxID=721885 RepID=UPI00044495FE|nr:uncharacterized protein STEHIDRAFT_124460 [Stereum hirsutum FP-91666 SS1]EIM82274.1 hypothetical protein STEHIDRAFT_124460 [Stereum hirsutum FP-91666 SS1]